MKLLALAVLLTVMQAAPPIPRQTTDNTAKNVQSKSATDRAKPSPAPAPLRADSDGPPKADGDEQHPDNAEQSVRVTELPSVTVNSPRKNWADWGMLTFNLLLAVTSGFQVWLLFKTLTFVSRQTHEMKRQRIFMGGQLKAMQAQIGQMQESGKQTDKMVEAAQESADAAKVSADIAARVSLPTLKIHRFEIGDVGSASNLAFFQYPKFKITVKNYGQTPAFLTSWTLKFTCEDLPDIPDYGGPREAAFPLKKKSLKGEQSTRFQICRFTDAISFLLLTLKL